MTCVGHAKVNNCMGSWTSCRPHRTTDRLGPVLLSHPREIDLHGLRLEPNRLAVARQGLPDLHNLRQAWQRVKINSEFKPCPVTSFPQEGLGFGRVVAIQPIKTSVPLWIIDFRPKTSSGAANQEGQEERYRYNSLDILGRNAAISRSYAANPFNRSCC